jgi:hypothetical protein
VLASSDPPESARDHRSKRPGLGQT